MSPSEEAFRFDQVSFRSYDGHAVLDGIHLVGNRGSATALVGHVGGGKTSVLRLLSGSIRPSGGRVLALGQDLSVLSYEEMRTHRMKIGFAFEASGLLGNMTIGQNIALAYVYHRDDARGGAATAHALGVELGIESQLDEPPFRVNGSVRKRALLARALCLEPELLLCDEPQVGLTRKEAMLACEAIERRRAERALTVVYADHDGYLDPFSVTRTYYLENGRLLTAPSIRPPLDRGDRPLAERPSLSTALIYRGTPS